MTASGGPELRWSPPRRTEQDTRPNVPDGPHRPRIVDRYTALTALWLGALTVATWPAVVAATGPGFSPVGLLAHVCGMLAGYGVLVLLVLISRSPALELGIGADVLARWHARCGRVVVGLVLAHGVAAVTAWAQARNVNLLTGAREVLAMPGLAAATAGTLLMLIAAGVSIRAARRRLRHESWHGLHLLMYAAIALSFGHVLAGPDLAGYLVLQIGWALAYTHVFALVLRHRVLTPIRQAVRHKLRVTAVRAEGPGAVSIVVEGRHLEELLAESGQFFRWRFLTRSHWLNAHPFSLSAAPTGTSLRLTVKALGDGTHTLQNLPVGTRVIAEGPYGAVTSARRTRRNVLLIAGGVGITPMRALFETIPVNPGEDLLLLYRARTPADALFKRELDDIAARRGVRVQYIVGEGRDRLSSGALRSMVPDLPGRDVFMCGPPGLMMAVRKSLREAGLPRQQLHEERFDL
jgi:predicted ferric reductase